MARLRVSQSVRAAPFRVRVSVPVAGKGRAYVSAGTRSPLGWLGVSAPLGGRRRRRSR